MRALTALAVLALCAASMLGFCGAWHWSLELLGHFRPHFAVLLLPAVALCCWRGWWRLAWLAGACLGVQLGCLLPYVPWPTSDTPRVSADEGLPRLRLVVFNVRTGNRDRAAVARWLGQCDADVVCLMEVGEVWLQALAGIAARYPNRIAEPRDDNFGIALWSRLPWADARIERLGAAGLPSAYASLELGDLRVPILATHPLPPGGQRTRLRDEQLVAAARLVRQRRIGVLCGDLNATPWSPVFRRLLRLSGLRDSGEGDWPVPTWPARLGFLGIPIDHCLLAHGDEVMVRRREVGPACGSDHRPLVLDLVLRAADARR